MHFEHQAALAEDRAFLSRIAACAAGAGLPGADDPLGWAFERRWQFAVTKGWCCAVEASGGIGQGITDQMIADAVAALLATDTIESPAG